MPRRSSVVPLPPPEEPKPGIHRCNSCGVGLAKLRRQPICSYCKGDPYYGGDGYFLDIIEEHIATNIDPVRPKPLRGAERKAMIEQLARDLAPRWN
jgi:hypothetical protein